MTRHTLRRLQAALLTLLLLCSLIVPVSAEGEDTGTTQVYVSLSQNTIEMNQEESRTLTAIVDPDNGQTVNWSVEEGGEEIIKFDSTGSTTTITPLRPGQTRIRASVGDSRSVNCIVTVAGHYIKPEDAEVEIFVGESHAVPIPESFGSAKVGELEWRSDNQTVADYSGNRIVGFSAGSATFTVSANGYTATVKVTVLSNDAEPINERASAGSPLAFTDMESKINTRSVEVTKGSLSYVTGLFVAPKEGTLYLGYKSEAEPGAGVAQTQSYYPVGGTSRGPYIQDITFVPNPNFNGKATIRYSGVASNNRNFSGVISVDIDNATASMTLDATVQNPAKFTGQLFSRVCQSKLGESIKEVVFALPAETRGTLYLDYASESDYGSRVETGRRYRLSELDRISFVPAHGFAGTVTVYYTGYGVTGGSYRGEITITVRQQTEGGPVYNTAKNSAVTFDGGDFDDYCDAQTGRVLRYVQFTLPSASQGTLYYDYRSSTQLGSAVQAGVNYYMSQNPRISRVTFVPANEFTGRVQIPFTGWDDRGNRFSGTAEVNVRTGGGSGDVYYICAAGRSVKLDNDDFNDLSLDLTGDRLYSITFNSLPSTGDGALYHSRTSSSSGTRVKTKVEYFNSRSPRIDNLSFWATNSFSGAVEVPFTAYTVNDDSFSGTMVIDSRSSGGSSSRPEIEYDTDYREAVTFSGRDFDDLCVYETDDDLNYVRFTQPSSSVGTLYYNYRSSSSTGSKVNSSTSYYYSGSGNTISKVSFVPANSFYGTAEIDFNGYAKDGTKFNGTVVVNVGEAAPEARVTYTTRQAPVNLRSGDFEDANRRVNLRSVRFAYMPSSAAGRLYFQYTSPTVYGWQATANTEYQISGSPALSSLTFVPKAGYTGTVTIPYTATATNGSQYGGELIIYVEGGGYSVYFSDMGSYSAEAQSAVDYLKEQGVVSGITATTYGPEMSIRRGDFALMLVRAFKLSAGGGTGQRFSDVPATAYYADAVQTLRALGIVSGTGGNQYQPTSTLSRQDAMLMVQRAMRISGYSAGDGPSYVLSSYSDSGSVSGYAQGAMAYVVQQGLLPTTGNRLAPRDALSRVDMAVLLHRAMTM